MNPELLKKSIHDLRIMAQVYGLADIFSKDAKHLAQEIDAKLEVPTVKVTLPERNEYDARLLTQPPNMRTDMDGITDVLKPFIEIGLKLSFEHEHWVMQWGKRNDTGTIRMPLRHIVACAERLMA